MKNNLVEIRTRSSIYYVSIEQITFMEYKPFSDTLLISFSGGPPVTVDAGKQLLDKLNSYLNLYAIDTDYIEVIDN